MEDNGLVQMDRDQTKQKIEELVKKYRDFEKTRSRKDMDSTSEANVHADFIDPLFEIPGWDIWKNWNRLMRR